MQPFDALTMRAIINEARPILLNRRVEKIQQVARDEVILSLRSKGGNIHLLVSAQASYGRICLTSELPRVKGQSPPGFCQQLRKHLSSAILVGMEQLKGERVANFFFLCTDDMGDKSTKILSAEIMGRHSNLVLWEQKSATVLACSHIVTAEMSRQRELAPGIKYVTPPKQAKMNIFSVNEGEFYSAFDLFVKANPELKERAHVVIEQWLLDTFAGLGRPFAEEVVETAWSGDKEAMKSMSLLSAPISKLYDLINEACTVTPIRASMRKDLSKFSVFSWWVDLSPSEVDEAEWFFLPSANDMVETYFRSVQKRAEMHQLTERIRSELNAEKDRLSARVEAAEKQIAVAQERDRLKLYGDLIFLHINEIDPGQNKLQCVNIYNDSNEMLEVELNPSLSPSQNAQNYYRLYAKARIRGNTADTALRDAREQLQTIEQHFNLLKNANSSESLARLKEAVLDRQGRKSPNIHSPNPKTPQAKEKARRERLISTKSSDGLLIIVGRNKNENDFLVSRLMQPQDIWLHAQSLEGAHVLIKVAGKKDPPFSTVKEAAQLAARFSRSGLGDKIRIVYTHGKYVRKLGKDKLGQVRYENERTVEVDTADPMPPALRKLFT